LKISKYFKDKKKELIELFEFLKEHSDFSDWKKVILAIAIFLFGLLIVFFMLRYFLSVKMNIYAG